MIRIGVFFIVNYLIKIIDLIVRSVIMSLIDIYFQFLLSNFLIHERQN